MVTILNLIITLALALCSWLMISYFIFIIIKADTYGFSDRALRVLGYVLTIASISWFFYFIWLVRIGFIKMKIFLWVRNIYFTIQEGRLLELLLK